MGANLSTGLKFLDGSMSSAAGKEASSPALVSIERAALLTIEDAAVLMLDNKSSCLMVLAGDASGTVEGIVTEQDIVRNSLARRGIGVNSVVSIAAVMTCKPFCIQVDDESSSVEEYFEQALQLMAKRSFRHVPFVRRSDGEFLGCVDIVQAVASGQCASILAHTLSFPAGKLMRMQAALSGQQHNGRGSGLRARGQVLEAGSSCEDAALLMSKNRRSALLVVGDRGALVGIVTESDIVRKVLAKGRGLAETAVQQVMTAKPFTVPADINPYTGIKTMVDKKFRHLPVVSERRVVSVLDILTLVKVSYTAQQQQQPAGGSTGATWSSALKNKVENDATPMSTKSEGISDLDDHTANSSDSGCGATATATTTTATTTTSASITSSEEQDGQTEQDEEQEEEADALPICQASAAERSGVESIMNGDFENAIVLLSQAISLRNDALQTAESLAESCLEQFHLVRLHTRRGTVKSCNGQLDDAMKDLNQALEWSQEARGSCESDLSEERQALSQLRDEAAAGVCEILVETGCFEEAARRGALLAETDGLRAKECAQQIAREALKFKDLGKELFISRDFAGAIVAYTSAIRAEKAHQVLAAANSDAASKLASAQLVAVLLGNRAACYQSVRDFKYALQDAKESLETDPQYAKAWLRACDCLMEMGKAKECQEMCQQALAEIDGSTNNAALRTRIGGLLEKAKAQLASDKSAKLASIKSLGQAMSKVRLNDENLSENVSSSK